MTSEHPRPGPSGSLPPDSCSTAPLTPSSHIAPRGLRSLPQREAALTLHRPVSVHQLGCWPSPLLVPNSHKVKGATSER